MAARARRPLPAVFVASSGARAAVKRAGMRRRKRGQSWPPAGLAMQMCAGAADRPADFHCGQPSALLPPSRSTNLPDAAADAAAARWVRAAYIWTDPPTRLADGSVYDAPDQCSG